MRKLISAKAFSITVLTLIGLAFIIPAQATKLMTSKDFLSECKPTIKTVSVNEARTMHDSGEWLFLDVRTEKEFKKGSIPEAVHLQRGLLEFRIEKKIPDKTARIVVYCKSGSRSTLSACVLKRMGYVNAVSMDGGWKGWVKEGHPIG